MKPRNGGVEIRSATTRRFGRGPRFGMVDLELAEVGASLFSL
ncbi:unnamed protein product [Linum tenue]|uniref:Uncharacterized protein n=1 Tax=Linum tenue TaxID=586396 RepID=A0AAV0NYR6_9ROSI|nr:unnamed protein product [Linum tenue]